LEIKMLKGPSKQSSVRLPEEMRSRIAVMAEQEGRTLSSQIVWLLRGALAQKSFLQSQQRDRSAA
jgi:hypothetical protein